MESLRGKGTNQPKTQQTSSSGSKSEQTSSVPLAIRFHTGEESVEEILLPPASYPADTGGISNIDAGRSSLSSSPQLNSDDFSWRKDFLQNSFFHRKRSGSVEGNAGGGSSPGSNILSTLSNSTGEPSSVGTWKLIKGKVSQAMEDIKSKNNPQLQPSSQSSSQSQKAENPGGDSDPETSTSDDISLDLSTGFAQSKQQPKSLSTPAPTQISGNDSDFDADVEILDAESIPQIAINSAPNIKRPFASLRSKAMSASKSASAKRIPTLKTAKDEMHLFRRRKKEKQADPASSAVPISSKQKKDVEIESGVEMLEDMILPQSMTMSALNDQDESRTQFHTNEKSQSEFNNTLPSDRATPLSEYCYASATPDLNFGTPPPADRNLYQSNQTLIDGQSSDTDCQTTLQLLRYCLSTTVRSRATLVAVALLAVLVALPLADFFRGIVACLFAIALFSSISELFARFVEKSDVLLKLFDVGRDGPERTLFQIPDYSKLPICEIPAAEEHKPLKSYAGWMNEINSYDPTNFHISMTRPVYIRLDGTILRIFNTNARIPKRIMWNEPPIHRKNVTFTKHRFFNLLDCRVEMCPRGLARKRHFNRKYPIQLIINTSTEVNKVEKNKPINSGTGASQPGDNIPPTVVNPGNTDASISHQNSNDSNEDPSEKQTSDFDFGTTVLQSNLQKLYEGQQQQPDTGKGTTVPCGDETRLLLFARCDREKEDWYRRFVAASMGKVNEQELLAPDIVMLSDEEISAAFKAVPTPESIDEPPVGPDGVKTDAPNSSYKPVPDEDEPFEGLIIASNAASNCHDYVRFMSLYQNRWQKKQDELWKGIDPSLFFGPSGNVVWANVLIGRALYGCLNDPELLEKIQDFLQKKLSAIKLPSFMEDVVIAQTHLGDTPPLIHRVSQPLLDERGVWVDADVTYEGLMHMTITTKLNLLRLKRQQQQSHDPNSMIGVDMGSGPNGEMEGSGLQPEVSVSSVDETPVVSTASAVANGGAPAMVSSAIYDSDAESSGASSSDSESPVVCPIDSTQEPLPPSTGTSSQAFYNAPGNSRRLLRIVDRITASNLFQSAAEIPYIQRAMENMSTKITLRVELKGLVSRVVVNLPPPPSDRIWLAFRGPPRLWISAKPAVGDHTFDWSIVTNVIESKLCDEVYKYLVYPNMVDIIAPFLGKSTYKE